MDWSKFKTRKEALRYIKDNVGWVITEEDARAYLAQNVPREAQYQARVIDALKRKYPAAFIWKAAAGFYSQGGIPDVCMVLDGQYFGFEIKRPFFGRATALQLVTLGKIRAAGGVAEIVTYPAEAFEIIDKTMERRRHAAKTGADKGGTSGRDTRSEKGAQGALASDGV